MKRVLTDQIQAMELAGAVLLSSFRTENDFQSQEAFRYWRQSIQLQLRMVTAGLGPISKLPVIRVSGE